jgi:hypothetical protein
LYIYSGIGSTILAVSEDDILALGTFKATPSTGRGAASPVITRQDLVNLGLISA